MGFYGLYVVPWEHYEFVDFTLRWVQNYNISWFEYLNDIYGQTKLQVLHKMYICGKLIRNDLKTKRLKENLSPYVDKIGNRQKNQL